MGSLIQSEFKTYFLIAKDEFGNLFIISGYSTKRQAVTECGLKKKYYGVIKGTGGEFWPGEYINHLVFETIVYARAS